MTITFTEYELTQNESVQFKALIHGSMTIEELKNNIQGGAASALWNEFSAKATNAQSAVFFVKLKKDQSDDEEEIGFAEVHIAAVDPLGENNSVVYYISTAHQNVQMQANTDGFRIVSRQDWDQTSCDTMYNRHKGFALNQTTLSSAGGGGSSRSDNSNTPLISYAAASDVAKRTAMGAAWLCAGVVAAGAMAVLAGATFTTLTMTFDWAGEGIGNVLKEMNLFDLAFDTNWAENDSYYKYGGSGVATAVGGVLSYKLLKPKSKSDYNFYNTMDKVGEGLKEAWTGRKSHVS